MLLNNRRRMFVLGLLDASIVALTVLLVYLMRFDFEIPPPYAEILPAVMVTYVLCTVISFYGFKVYHRVWQYASIGELFSIMYGTLFAQAVCFLLHMAAGIVMPEWAVMPRSIYLFSPALIILGVGGSRFIWRITRDKYQKKSQRAHRRPLLIIGAGQAGVLAAKELKHAQNCDLWPVAFIDDAREKYQMEVVGLPVVGGRERIREAVGLYGIRDIIIAIPSASKAEIAKIIDICKQTSCAIKILPSVTDLISGRLTVGAMRDVQVEDLLGREPVQVDLAQIAGYVRDQVVLVTGAGGSIGSELCRQVSKFAPRRLLLLGHGENSIYEIEMELRTSCPELAFEPIIADVQDLSRMQEVFALHQPTVVFHAAAHKHVPLMERNPAEAIKNNVLGTRNVATCAHEFGASHFVMISSDKAVNPTSVMGVTKRVAEMLIQCMDRMSATKFVAVRFGNVLGSRGSVIPLFKRQIEQFGEVTVTHPEMVRYFMTIPEAVQLVIQAGALAQGGEVFILDMDKPVKIVDLARDLIRLSGLIPDEDVKIRFTGMRPGEKLYEELLTNEEGITATKHNRIFIGKPNELSWEQLQNGLSRLERCAVTPDSGKRSAEIRVLLQEIVPTYQIAPQPVPIPLLALGVRPERANLSQESVVRA